MTQSGSNFRLLIGGEVIDTSTATTAADVQKLVRTHLLAQAGEHRRQADALTPALERAALAVREAGNAPGTLLPELAEELDKPWDAAAFSRTAYGRFADARRVREAEQAANRTLADRRERRAKHAGGGWGCGWDTVEYAQAKADHAQIAAEHGDHVARATALEEKARTFRPATMHTTYQPVDRRKEAAALKRAAQPGKSPFTAGSWVRWDEPATGRTRFGVVTCDPLAYDGPPPNLPARTTVRYIVPADGGAVLPMAPRGAASSGSWRCQLPEWDQPAQVLPALAQDGLFTLPGPVEESEGRAAA